MPNQKKMYQLSVSPMARALSFAMSAILLISTDVCSQVLATGHSKFLGNVFGFSGVPAGFDSYWNQITPENNSKWDQVEGTRNVYNWTRLDEIYNYAVTKGYRFKFHTLVWGQQSPTWMNTLDSATQAAEVEEWIRLAGERYPSASFVDVVNEPMFGHAPATYRNALGGAGMTGWDWVIKAFEWARQYWMKGVKLVLNDYGIINNTSATGNFLTIINLLKDRNLIDGIGIQGHRFELESADTNTIKANLTSLAATGLPIYISEFDVAPQNTLNDATQLAEYQRIFPVLWQHPGVKGITLWGYIQGQTWQTNAYLRTSSGSERPALQWLRTYLASTATDVSNHEETIPAEFALEQNYPNPFNPSTNIRYSVPSASNVKIAVYSLLGVKVRTLVDLYQTAGSYSVSWDGTDDRNNLVSSGLFFYRLETAEKNLVKRMILLR